MERVRKMSVFGYASAAKTKPRAKAPPITWNAPASYAIARGWTVKETYDLAGISGEYCQRAFRMQTDAGRRAETRPYHRPHFFKAGAARPPNTKELLEFSDYFRDHNADLISISETIDTSSPAGRLFFTIIAAMATWEREEIADRQKASILVRAKLGKTINGRAPYGYQWKNRMLVSHPDEAPIRRKAYDLFLQYRRKGTVAKLLNAAGHRTREGVTFSDTQVGRILTCRAPRAFITSIAPAKTGHGKTRRSRRKNGAKQNATPLFPKTCGMM